MDSTSTKPAVRGYEELRVAEMVAISELLEPLSPEQWDAPSLCDGWRVRDVVSHMCVGYTTRMPVIEGEGVDVLRGRLAA